MANDTEIKNDDPLMAALAEYFEIDQNNILNYAIIVKHKKDDQEVFSSVWPATAPADVMLGLTGTLRIHIDRLVN